MSYFTSTYDNTVKIWNVDNEEFKTLKRKFESEFGAAHPVFAKT